MIDVLIILLTIILFILTLTIGIFLESRDYNHGKCKCCGGKLEMFDTDNQGRRLYACSTCGHNVWVSYNSVDKWRSGVKQMKITKKPDQCDMNVYRKEKANANCSVCPFCGNRKNISDFPKLMGVDKKYGIIPSFYTIKTKGIFKSRVYRTDHYKCSACGAEWESEEYLVE